MRTALAAILIFSVMLPSCEDQERAAEQKRAAEASAERAAKRKTERDAERRLMTTPAEAVPELERRMSNWLSVSNGVAIVVSERQGGFALVHSLPATSPWLVTCSRSGLEVKFGHWFELGAGPNEGAVTNELVSKELTTVALTEEECRPLVDAIGQRMQAVLGRR